MDGQGNIIRIIDWDELSISTWAGFLPHGLFFTFYSLFPLLSPPKRSLPVLKSEIVAKLFGNKEKNEIYGFTDWTNKNKIFLKSRDYYSPTSFPSTVPYRQALNCISDKFFCLAS